MCCHYLKAQTGGDRSLRNLKLVAGVILYIKEETEREVKIN